MQDSFIFPRNEEKRKVLTDIGFLAQAMHDEEIYNAQRGYSSPISVSDIVCINPLPMILCLRSRFES